MPVVEFVTVHRDACTPLPFDVEVTVRASPMGKWLIGSSRTGIKSPTASSTRVAAFLIVREETSVDRRVITALELIHANIHKRISIAELARAVNMSRWRFCHVFKMEMSLSPSFYIGALRMQAAEKMLRETFLSVKEIRAELGNLDRTHFSRAFKKFRGVTPAQFRRRLVADFHSTTTQ